MEKRSKAVRMKKEIDIIIPVYKPDSKFDLLMERLQKQTILPNHIYLLETRENKVESSLEEKWGDKEKITIVPIKKEEFDHGKTRNYGATLSKSDSFMFMTQDAVPADKRLIEEILNGLKGEKVAAVYARQLAGKEAGIVERYTRMFNYPEESSIKSKQDLNRLGIKTYFCSNVCAAYRNDIYKELGGFVTKTIFNEDMIMASNIIQAGYQIAYCANARVIHFHKYTYQQQFKRNFDMGVSQRQYKEIFESVKSESEGIRLVTNTIKYLRRERKSFLIPDLMMQSGFKYLGYKLGHQYEKLPKWLILKCTMNRAFWSDVK